jgi:hypothetical protein
LSNLIVVVPAGSNAWVYYNAHGPQRCNDGASVFFRLTN